MVGTFEFLAGNLGFFVGIDIYVFLVEILDFLSGFSFVGIIDFFRVGNV